MYDSVIHVFELVQVIAANEEPLLSEAMLVAISLLLGGNTMAQAAFAECLRVPTRALDDMYSILLSCAWRCAILCARRCEFQCVVAFMPDGAGERVGLGGRGRPSVHRHCDMPPPDEAPPARNGRRKLCVRAFVACLAANMVACLAPNMVACLALNMPRMRVSVSACALLSFVSVLFAW